MHPDLWYLYGQMLRSRLFEELVSDLWDDGYISGEMHMGIGEEGIVAGVLDHLEEGDALALDHRGTAPLVMRGVSSYALMAELLGRPDGLCAGQGGHMHLYSPEHLAASSGIVGAAGPAGAGFALAGQLQRPGSAAFAFFGEGALNEGMLMESFNLAAVWQLPLLFICKDDGWAIFTRTDSTSRSTPLERARGFGMTAISVDGNDPLSVWRAAGSLLATIRAGEGPAFLHATCTRPHAHFLGDPLLRMAKGKRRDGLGSLVRSLTRIRGDSFRGRARTSAELARMLRQTAVDRDHSGRDPVDLTRRQLLEIDRVRVEQLEQETAAALAAEMAPLLADLQEMVGRP